MMDKMLTNRVAIISGGARGIGKAIAEKLADDGSKIIIIDPGYSINGNHDEKNIAEKVLNEVNQNLNGKVSTKISKEKNYCKAEEYHQKYFQKKSLK